MIEASKAHITLATRVGQLQLEAALAEENIDILAREGQALRAQLDERTTQLSETSHEREKAQADLTEQEHTISGLEAHIRRLTGDLEPMDIASDHEVSNDEQAAPDSESERATPTVITDI
mgnify:CR=1 FL=1